MSFISLLLEEFEIGDPIKVVEKDSGKVTIGILRVKDGERFAVKSKGISTFKCDNVEEICTPEPDEMSDDATPSPKTAVPTPQPTTVASDPQPDVVTPAPQPAAASITSQTAQQQTVVSAPQPIATQPVIPEQQMGVYTGQPYISNGYAPQPYPMGAYPYPYGGYPMPYTYPTPMIQPQLEITETYQRFMADPKPFSCDEKTINTYKKDVLTKEIRSLVSGYVESFLSGIRSRDIGKQDEAIGKFIDAIEEDETDTLYYDKGANNLLAYMSYISKDYDNAFESFCYADNLMEAYNAAYTAEQFNDAAALAAMYIVKHSFKDASTAEAFRVLAECCIRLRDISALLYIEKTMGREYIADGVDLMQLTMKHINRAVDADILDFNNVGAALERLRNACNKTESSKCINRYAELCDNVTYKPDISEEDNSKDTAKPTPADDELHLGQIIVNRWLSKKGTILCEGKEYTYSLNDITDLALKNLLMKTDNEQLPIDVCFNFDGNKPVKIFRKTAAPKRKNTNNHLVDNDENLSPEQLLISANHFFTQRMFDRAQIKYLKLLDTKHRDEGIFGYVLCNLALSNDTKDENYVAEAVELVKAHESEITNMDKAGKILSQLFVRSEMYDDALKYYNIMLDQCPVTALDQRLDCIKNIIRCYSKMENYQKVIENCIVWENMWKNKSKGNITNDSQLRNEIYPALAEAYYYTGEFEKARKIASKSPNNARCVTLIRILDSNMPDDNEQEEIISGDTLVTETVESTTIDSVEESEQTQEPECDENTLEDFYEEYHDNDGIFAVGKNREQLVETAFSFGKGNEYCMLAYLHAAARLDKNYFAPLYRAASYACDNPTERYLYNTAQVSAAFDELKTTFPMYYDDLFSAAVLRTAFYGKDPHDYGMSAMCSLFSETPFAQKHPVIIGLLDKLAEFRAEIGVGVSTYAGAKTDTEAKISAIVKDAIEYRDTVIIQSIGKEGVERIRALRMIMFGEDSQLFNCYSAVCEDDRQNVASIAEQINSLFIKKHRELAVTNIDKRNMDYYIDLYWNKAGEYLKKTGKSSKSANEDLMSGRRQNVTKTAERMIGFICDWVNAVNATSSDSASAIQKFNSIKESICIDLEQLYKECNDEAQDSFSAIVYTIRELLDRMNGTFDPKKRKYFYIGFLLGDQIMLNEDFMPELYSTFSFLPDFNIFSRIESFVESEKPTFEEKIESILSDDIESKYFRALKLIRQYAEDNNIESLTQNPNIANVYRFLDSYIQQTKRRIQLLKKSFDEELALSQSYGRISNSEGRVTMLRECSDIWYKIALKTQDYGFYANLVKAVNNKISHEAEKYGNELMKQVNAMEWLTTDENGNTYPHGGSIYSKEMIEGFINDQNYTVAEDMMNRILRGDMSEVRDFSLESMSYLNNLLNEYARIYDIASRNDVSLETSIRRYTTSAMKDVKGGIVLIQNWIKKSNDSSERLAIFLDKLGWKKCTVTKDTNCADDEAYLITREKLTGRQNYPHPLPAFSSQTENEPFRVLCLYGSYDCDRLVDKFRQVNNVSLNTLVLLDYSLGEQDRRRLARKLKEEAMSKPFIVIDKVLLYYLAEHYQDNKVNRMLMATTMPFAYYQPFVSESAREMPPELFTGRINELNEIENVDGVNLVYGGRQLGKSALLRKARKDIDRNALGDRAIFVDIINMDAAESAFKVSTELVDEGILTTDCITHDWETLARSIKKRLSEDYDGDKIHYLLLMLDEADAFIEDCKKNDYKPISALKAIQGPHFKFVLAGLHNLIRFDHEATVSNNANITHLKSIVVRPFQSKEATELLTHTLSYLGLRIEDTATISLILATTNYFPGLIQLYCRKLLEAMRNPNYAGYSELNTPPYYVTENHIKSVLSDPEFTSEIRTKLEITLRLDMNQGGYYHALSLIIAYYLGENPEALGCTLENIRQLAVDLGIARITEIDSLRASELMEELCALNVLRENGGIYNFSGNSYRELLGSHEDISNSLYQYMS